MKWNVGYARIHLLVLTIQKNILTIVQKQPNSHYLNTIVCMIPQIKHIQLITMYPFCTRASTSLLALQQSSPGKTSTASPTSGADSSPSVIEHWCPVYRRNPIQLVNLNLTYNLLHNELTESIFWLLVWLLYTNHQTWTVKKKLNRFIC